MQLGLDPRHLLQPPQEPPDASGVPALVLGCCNVAIVEQVASMAIAPADLARDRRNLGGELGRLRHLGSGGLAGIGARLELRIAEFPAARLTTPARRSSRR